ETGIRLEIIGSLAPILPKGQQARNQYIIHGMSSTGRLCTLIENVIIGHVSLVFSGVASETYQCRYLFIGGHFSTFEDLSFTVMSVNFTGLEEWLGWSPFSSSHQTQNNNHHETFTYNQPEPIIANIPSQRLALRFVSEFSASQSLRRTVKLEHEAFI